MVVVNGINRAVVRLIALVLIAAGVTGCVSTASVATFSKTNSTINFDEISKRDLNGDGSTWTFKGYTEYFVAIRSENEKSLMTLLTKAIENKGYSIKYSSEEGKAIIGERGLSLNEWGAVVGVYFKPRKDQYWVYVRVDVTQDITGGLNQNHAAAVISEICRLSRSCEMVQQ